jgi:hypothetical protein
MYRFSELVYGFVDLELQSFLYQNSNLNPNWK